MLPRSEPDRCPLSPASGLLLLCTLLLANCASNAPSSERLAHACDAQPIDARSASYDLQASDASADAAFVARIRRELGYNELDQARP